MVIKSTDLLTFLQKTARDQLGGFTEIFAPATSPWSEPRNTFFTPLHDSQTPLLDSYRTVDPVKILIYHIREQIQNNRNGVGKHLILGVKACDLKALLLLDDALKNRDVIDPSYAKWRDTSTIVSTDCGSIAATCHCTLVGGKPYAESDFDLNLAAFDDSYWITIGTERGKELVDLMSSITTVLPGQAEQWQRVVQRRERIIQELAQQNQPFQRRDGYLDMRHCGPQPWKEEATPCIGCGACTNICPTCYCLILNDESKEGTFIKERSYDSCQWNGYARVAGGSSPRPKMNQRFRNRYLCKFDYMYHNFNRIGCTGCGRCTEACAGEIDFRRVVKAVQDSALAGKNH
ncbi:MAG: hypothetical protein EHM72_02980 [Calditrichaeota bacterium]|nr:MAG: hypothetical protein EHM72_02980 [Calditrichota bacterium]